MTPSTTCFAVGCANMSLLDHVICRNTHAHVVMMCGQESPKCMHMNNDEDQSSHNICCWTTWCHPCVPVVLDSSITELTLMFQ